MQVVYNSIKLFRPCWKSLRLWWFPHKRGSLVPRIASAMWPPCFARCLHLCTFYINCFAATGVGKIMEDQGRSRQSHRLSWFNNGYLLGWAATFSSNEMQWVFNAFSGFRIANGPGVAVVSFGVIQVERWKSKKRVSADILRRRHRAWRVICAQNVNVEQDE